MTRRVEVKIDSWAVSRWIRLLAHSCRFLSILGDGGKRKGKKLRCYFLKPLPINDPLSTRAWQPTATASAWPATAGIGTYLSESRVFRLFSGLPCAKDWKTTWTSYAAYSPPLPRPPSQIQHDACGLVDSKYVLTRPLVESDFAAFDKYARRVRIADFSELGGGRTAGRKLFVALAPCLPAAARIRLEAVFGRQHRWRISSHLVRCAYGQISLTIGTNLDWDHFVFSGYTKEWALETFDAQSLAALVDVPFGAWIPDDRGGEFPSPRIMDGLGPELLAYLAGLPHLFFFELDEEAEESILDFQRIVAARRRTGQRSFPVVEKFSIRGYGCAGLRILFAHINSAALRAISFGLPDVNLVDASLLLLFTAPYPIRTLEQRTSLRHVDFSGPSSSPARLPGSVLEALYAFPHLETLRIHSAIALHDADIDRMTASWPALETLFVYDGGLAPANGANWREVWRAPQREYDEMNGLIIDDDDDGDVGVPG
ncbi:hypothetical protein FB451DRAFT_1377333 [Mycena latifolia]|nr:hypothetical protein FB451DRAFT_1377333 [Mycena latifolia]